MEPILKWVGSKRWHVEEVKHFFNGTRVVELFAGSAAISFGLDSPVALLNDANPHLINFYRHAQAGDMADFSGATTEKEYYTRRDWFNRLVRENKADSAIAAGLFYYINAVGFNNLWRVNRAGECNVPFRKGREYVPALELVEFPKLWEFTNDDFREVILEGDDFVYADPPYLETFGSYTAEEFTEFDFAELVALLTGHPGRVVIMNSATPRAVAICRDAGLHCVTLESKQKMHLSRGRDDVIPELMATNFVV